jgi:hypothetical protein
MCVFAVPNNVFLYLFFKNFSVFSFKLSLLPANPCLNSNCNMETLSVYLLNYMGRKWVSFLRDKRNKMINSDLLKENILS